MGVIAPYYDKFPFINRCSNDRDILFYGAMNRVENYSSAIWFIESVLPLLRERDVRFIAMDDRNAPWVKLPDGTGQPEDDQQKILTYICNDYFGGRNKHGIE